MLDRVNLHAEGALERRDRPDRADHQPVRKPLRHPEPARSEMRDDGTFVRFQRRVPCVELRLREELVIPRRCGVLNIGEEGIEAGAVAQLEPDDDVMAVGRARAAVIGRDGDQWRAGPRLPDVGRAGAGGRDDDTDDGDDGTQCPPRDRPTHAVVAHPFRDSGRTGSGSSNLAVEPRGMRRHGECRGERELRGSVTRGQRRSGPTSSDAGYCTRALAVKLVGTSLPGCRP